MGKASSGDLVQIHLTGRLENGAVFLSSLEKGPLRFVVGGEGMPEGISQAVDGMRVGESKTVTLSPGQAFGPRDPARERQVPRRALPAEIRVGDQVAAAGEGRQERFWVRHLGDVVALLDGNHPLAGLTLTFDVELVSAEPTSPAP